MDWNPRLASMKTKISTRRDYLNKTFTLISTRSKNSMCWKSNLKILETTSENHRTWMKSLSKQTWRRGKKRCFKKCKRPIWIKEMIFSLCLSSSHPTFQGSEISRLIMEYQCSWLVRKLTSIWKHFSQAFRKRKIFSNLKSFLKSLTILSSTRILLTRSELTCNLFRFNACATVLTYKFVANKLKLNLMWRRFSLRISWDW